MTFTEYQELCGGIGRGNSPMMEEFFDRRDWILDECRRRNVGLGRKQKKYLRRAIQVLGPMDHRVEFYVRIALKLDNHRYQ